MPSMEAWGYPTLAPRGADMSSSLFGVNVMPTLERLLEGVDTGRPVGRGSLYLVPLFRTGRGTPPVDYLLGIDAVAQGQFRISEVSDEGTISEVLVASEADIPVLLLEGEELVGAMQNRLADADVLVGPHASVRIPVCCCEEGRWSPLDPEFQTGNIAPPAIRASKTWSVSRSLQSFAIVRSDQRAVWQEIDSLFTRTSSSSGTRAMSACFGHRSEYLQMGLDNSICPADAVGVVAVVNDRFAALDMFDRPATLRRLWDRLLASYALDTKGTAGVVPPATLDIKALAVLETLRKIPCVVRDGVGLGTDWRFESADLFGSALAVDGTAVHLSAFPTAP